MIKISDELEIALERLVRERMKDNYASEYNNRQWVYEDFANWLVKQFVKDTSPKESDE